VTVIEGTSMEIMRCTARSGTTLTVARGQEGTTAKTFGAGATVDHRLTNAALQAFLQDAPGDGKQYGRQSAAWAEVLPNPTWTTLAGKPATFPPTLPIAESDVTNLVADLAAKAALASPTFTGDPKAPTPTAGDNDTSLATTAFVAGAVGNRLTDAPSDTNAYGRKAGAWVDVSEEAPADGITYGRKNGAWVASIGGATVSDTPPTPPLVQGQLLWESDTGITYIWYDDGNTTQWVQIAGSPANMAQNYVQKAGDTMTGGLTLTGTSQMAIGTTPSANSRSSLTVISEISINGAGTAAGAGALGFNGYVDTTVSQWKASAAGYVGYLYMNPTLGDFILARSDASLAAGAVMSASNLLAFSANKTATFASHLFVGGGSSLGFTIDATNATVSFGASRYLTSVIASGDFALATAGGFAFPVTQFRRFFHPADIGGRAGRPQSAIGRPHQDRARRLCFR